MSKYANVYYYFPKHFHTYAWYFHRIPAKLKSYISPLPRTVLDGLGYIFNFPHKFHIDFNPSIIDGVIIIDPTFCNFDLKKFRNAITIYWSWDNIYRVSLIHDLILLDLENFDYVFSGHKDTVKYFEKAGTKSFWLPFFYDPELNFPIDRKKIYDISFVGNMYGHRKDYIFYLQKKYSHLRYFFGNAYQKDQNEIYNSSKIVLNFPNVEELNFRVFEALGSGSFLLNEKSEETMELFEDGADLVFFKDKEELTVKIDYYLEHEEERQQIAKKGYMKVSQFHTLDSRIKNMLKISGLLWN